MRWVVWMLWVVCACECGDGGGGVGVDGGDECVDSRNCPFGFMCVDGTCVPAMGRDAGGDDASLRDGSTADGSSPSDAGTDAEERFDARRPDGGDILERTFQYGVERGGEITLYDVLVNELPSRDDVPVFLYLPAAGEPYDSPVAKAWLRTMAEVGYLAASAEYDDSPQASCGALSSKAEGIFRGSGVVSGGLLFDLCEMVGSVCDRGVVVAGHGQGGQIAMLARNYDARIQGVLAMGVGYVMSGGSVNDRSCLVDTRSLPADRLRVVNGASDTTYGPFEAFPGLTETLREQMEVLTANRCGALDRCLRADGSGWIVVGDGLVSDGGADHCFHASGGCGGTPDPNWETTADDWGLSASRDWFLGLTPF